MNHTVNDLMQQFQVTQHTVLAWIASGDLRAVDVSRQRGGRPRWRITEEARAKFELLRQSRPAPPQKRRRKQTADVIDFY